MLGESSLAPKKNQRVIVTDQSTVRLQYFNRHDLILLVIVSSNGTNLGQFNWPCGQAFTSHLLT